MKSTFIITFEAATAARFVGVATLLVAAGCSSDSDDKTPSAASEHLYALQTLVYQPDETTLSYVAVTDTLDVSGELTLRDAKELPGYAFATTINGKLLISSGEGPEITQYEVESASVWHERATLSFAGQGVPSFGAGLERHWFLNERVAYLTHEVTSRIVWDPTEMVIRGVEEDTGMAREAGGLVLDAAFNRPPRLLKGPVLKPFYYRDEDWFYFGESSRVAIYDQTTHAERTVLELPCPGLEVMSQAENGDTYFAPWTYGPTLSLFGEGPATCVRRVKANGTVDEAWAPDLSTWTDGRPVQVLRYVKDGKALGTVLHIDEVEGDFSAGYDQALADELDGHWRLWEFDLEAETARVIEEIPSSGSGFSMSEVDGRTFVFIPNEEWSETTVYEIELGGAARARFRTRGIVNTWSKIR